MKFEKPPSEKADKYETRYAELRERLDDPKHLPSLRELKTVFGYSMEKGKRQDWYDYVGPQERLNETTGKYERTPNTKWRHEVLTREHVERLAMHLQERAKHYSATVDKPLKVIEVGAGDGRLTHFLNENLSNLVHLEATDSGYSKIKPEFPVTIVKGARGETEGLDPIKSALEQYKPDLVISSWMPYEKDWTKTFRGAPSVKEYILIGDPEVCGDVWQTWGWDSEKSQAQETPPFVEEGFSATRLRELEKFQVCRTDHVLDDKSHSRTVSFSREEQK